jgi:hypothetical protein
MNWEKAAGAFVFLVVFGSAILNMLGLWGA